MSSILDETTALPAGFGFNNISGYAMRTTIAGSAFSGPSLGQLRFSFMTGNGAVLDVDHCSVALVGSATAPDTQLTPTEITFGGASGFSIAGAFTSSGPSDWINFAFNNLTDTMLVDIDLNAAANNSVCLASIAGFNGWYKDPAADWNNATVSGYSAFSGFDMGVLLIETQAGGGGGDTLAGPMPLLMMRGPRLGSRNIRKGCAHGLWADGIHGGIRERD